MPEEDRDELLAYAELVCPRCGNLREVCSDPDRGHYPQRSMCYVTATVELTRRRVAKRYEKNEPGTDGLHPLDGMVIWASPEDLTPDDDFV